jgi:hypothetical protein
MTYRLCVIGNSHLAAFKLGWDQLLAKKDARIAAITPTFFGAPRDGVKNLDLREGHLVPTTEAVKEHFLRLSGGRAHIDPALYDGFLLVGLGASMKRTLRLYRTHRWFGVQQKADCPVVSRAFAQAFLAQGYAATRLAQVAQMLRSATDKPVFVTPEPYWAAVQADQSAKTGDYGSAKAAASGDGDRIAQMFVAAMTQALGPHATLIWQPDATIENGIVTRARFNKGASKFITGEGKESDAAHMNGDYGAVWWAEAAGLFLPARKVAAKSGPIRTRRSA